MKIVRQLCAEAFIQQRHTTCRVYFAVAMTIVSCLAGTPFVLREQESLAAQESANAFNPLHIGGEGGELAVEAVWLMDASTLEMQSNIFTR